MYKFLFKFIFIAILIAYFASCQDSKLHHHSCNYYGNTNYTDILSSLESGKFKFPDSQPADKIVSDIVNHVGLQRNFKIVADASVQNAAAAIINNERYILYNNDFIELANDLTSSNWSSISILAHEIGHHLQGHTLSSDGSRPNLELEADKFSGFVLAKMGASLEDAQKALQVLVSENGSSTHPARVQRLSAVAEGFNQAYKLTNSIAPKSKVVEKNNTESIDEKSSNGMTKEEYLNMPDNYGVELLQTGGEGSRQVQVTAFYLDEHGYMDEASSKVCYFFNSVADILWICNPPGFEIKNVEYYENDITHQASKSDDLYNVRILNQLQNKVLIIYSKTTLSDFLIESKN